MLPAWFRLSFSKEEDDPVVLNIFLPKRSLPNLPLKENRFLKWLLVNEPPCCDHGRDWFRLRSPSVWDEFPAPLEEIFTPWILRTDLRATLQGFWKWCRSFITNSFQTAQRAWRPSWIWLFGVISSKHSAWKTWRHGRTPAIGISLLPAIRLELHGDFCRNNLLHNPHS